MWLYLLRFFCTFFYMSGSQVFPKPLTAKEERYYLEKYAEGDREAKQKLIERNLRLVAHVVKKYNNVNKDIDDLISIGTIGLIKAINSFDYTKGIRLATYAARCIDNELLMMIRSEKKQKNEISLQEPIGMDKEGNAITLNDVLEDSDRAIVDQVDIKLKTSQLYLKMKSSLKPMEQEVLELRYGLRTGKEKTQREVAKQLGISRSY